MPYFHGAETWFRPSFFAGEVSLHPMNSQILSHVTDFEPVWMMQGHANSLADACCPEVPDVDSYCRL